MHICTRSAIFRKVHNKDIYWCVAHTAYPPAGGWYPAGTFSFGAQRAHALSANPGLAEILVLPRCGRTPFPLTQPPFPRNPTSPGFRHTLVSQDVFPIDCDVVLSESCGLARGTPASALHSVPHASHSHELQGWASAVAPSGAYRPLGRNRGGVVVRTLEDRDSLVAVDNPSATSPRNPPIQDDARWATWAARWGNGPSAAVGSDASAPPRPNARRWEETPLLNFSCAKN